MDISDLIPDDKNANVGTDRGREMLKKSLKKYGFGRSLLIDKNNKIISGNKTTDSAKDIGFKDVRIVESDGTEIIAIKRTDLDLNKDVSARELAFADNRVSEVNLEWAPDEIKAAQESGIELSDFFSEIDLSIITGIYPEGEDPYGEWNDMPEFHQENQEAFKSVIVHFKNEDDLAAFAKLINQKMTIQTKSVWYPKAEIDNVADLEFRDEP